MTPEEAWDKGTNIRTAIRYQPEQTRAAVIRMIKNVADFIDAKKTLRGVEDILLTAQAIETQHPTIKLEELRLVFQGMMTGEYGKFYERLKTPEFLDAIATFEGKRADHLERIHTRQSVTRGLRPGQKLIPHKPETLMEVMNRRNPLRNAHTDDARREAQAEPEQPQNHQEPQVPPAGTEPD